MNTLFSMTKVVNLILIAIIVASSCTTANSQNQEQSIDYSQYPIAAFFFPTKNLDQVPFAYFNDKEENLHGTWRRKFLKKNYDDLFDGKSVKLREIVDEQLTDNIVALAISKNLMIFNHSIQLLSEKNLSNNETKHFISTIIFARPRSMNESTEWKITKEDGTVVTSVSEFSTVRLEEGSIPCIKVTQTAVLEKINRVIKQELYYGLGLGYMGSTIYNKSLKKMVSFDKIIPLKNDLKFD